MGFGTLGVSFVGFMAEEGSARVWEKGKKKRKKGRVRVRWEYM